MAGPTHQLVRIHSGFGQRVMTRAELEGRGLVAQAPPKPEAPASPFDVLTSRTVLHGPATSAAWKRGSADFTFCCIAIDLFKHTPEETARKLLEVSGKARENGKAYALDQVMNAAAKVAANSRKPGQEHRIAEALRSGAYSSSDDVIDRALEVLHQQNESLTANREANNAKIRTGIGELERGEGIPEDELDAYLARLKTQPE